MLEWLSRFQAFGVATAFWPWISGAATTPRWVVAALSVYFMTWQAFLFCVYCFFVLPPDAAIKWSVLAGAFSFGLKLTDIRWLTVTFAAGIAISGGVAVCQWLGWRPVPTLIETPVAGLFVNKNYMGEAAVLAIVVMLSVWNGRFLLIHWAALSGCVVAVALSTSRAVWLALLVSALVAIRWKRMWPMLAFGAGGVFIITIIRPGGMGSLFSRVELWAASVGEFRWFGAGSPLEPLHNEFLQIIFELGIGAAIPFGIGVYLGWRSSYVLPFLVTVGVIGCFSFPLHLPATGWFIAIVAGHLVGIQHAASRTVVVETRLDDSNELGALGDRAANPFMRPR